MSAVPAFTSGCQEARFRIALRSSLRARGISAPRCPITGDQRVLRAHTEELMALHGPVAQSVIKRAMAQVEINAEAARAARATRRAAEALP